MLDSYSYISVLDIFKIGVGPSSSHTTGPMIAAGQFRRHLHGLELNQLLRIDVHLYGSLSSTGIGHATDTAVMAGLLGLEPATVDPEQMRAQVKEVRHGHKLSISADQSVEFDPARNIIFKPVGLAYHPNALRFKAVFSDGSKTVKTYYSVGGGFVIDDDELSASAQAPWPSDAGLQAPGQVPYPFSSAADLLRLCAEHQLSISELVMANEQTLRPWTETEAALRGIWQAMQDCVHQGLVNPGVLPGGLDVKRRAPDLYQRLLASRNQPAPVLTMQGMDWVNVYAMAVNEENAAGGKVVTAPTNGAAGIIPAVLHFYIALFPDYSFDDIVRFLLTASAIAKLCKMNASISGAEVGCQGEVGSACAMAAAGLAALMGATPQQVENAAEIGLEHNLGLTCDPVGGLVQIPCIERNAIAGVKAINAARLAMHGDGKHHISLDQAIRTMRDTGRDMHDKYKETSLGGLAVAFTEC
ncbi:L-serine ammonia-lyase [Paenalcaligenes niemegkensis]|uniref:L-serine ammonia-lyase n=1 Tax=Paenalcaligenes niemegkensis TaxID=2895469 RepID=UPI001EE7BB33|nr:L-serine ammonia-lyase [Paenalcaligenes niemegkensis]MCQ9616184.1 L-serine ammonia-lyase [Paenalcaligenes niemegkensis]